MRKLFSLLAALGLSSACITVAVADQPPQPDSYTISGRRITEATGKRFSTDENQALTSIPGITRTNTGAPTVQGMPLRDMRYRYDGVPFTPPIGARSGSLGIMNGIQTIEVGN